ncbi:MAG TPA: alpha/beta hydrolase [Steroidobacter sp.]|uniref:alpha/beta fold hydrolase n=1 Tax=Steroidobacter sp. TaxID=1978227 RepID=UPI002ED81629
MRSAGKGAAVVFVHGWALDLDMWQAQLNLLAPWYRAIAFDRRGFGLSSGEPSIEQDVEDIARLLDCFGISQAAVVGMSQGARVALRWAIKHRERVSCLVLDGPPAEGLPLTVDTQEIPIDDYRATIRNQGIEAFRRKWAQHPFMRLYTTAPGARLLLQEIAARYPARDLSMHEPCALFPLKVGDLQGLSTPTLILNGEYDSEQRRATARQMAESLPDAHLKIISGAGHLAALDDHNNYARILHGFFSARAAMGRNFLT